MKNSKKIILAASLAAFVCLTGYGQSTGGPAATATTSTPPAIHPLPPAIKAQIVALRSQAVQLRTLVATLRTELKGKTAAEQKAIFQQFKQDNAALLDAQRTLAREIRTEMKLLRQQRLKTG